MHRSVAGLPAARSRASRRTIPWTVESCMPPPVRRRRLDMIRDSMLSVSNLTKAYGGQTLFEGVSLQFNAESRYGLVGANGSGKSTLLKIIAGDELANDGTISIPKRAKVGVLKQDHFRYENVPIIDVVMMGNQVLWQAMTQKELLLASAEQHF